MHVPSSSPRARMSRALLAAAALAGTAGLTPPARAQATPAARALALPASLPRLARASVLGRVDAAEPVSVAFTLPPRDAAGLDALLKAQSTPGDPLFHHFLTPAEFTARFGPTQADYDAVADYARSQGLTVTGTHPNRLLLEASGPASAAEAAFGVKLQRVRLAATAARAARVARVPDAAPRVPAALAGKVSGVVGLDTVSVRRGHLRRVHAQGAGARPSAGTGVGGGLSASDVRAAYGLDTFAGTGAGQTVAIFQLGTFKQSDVIAFEDANRLPHVPFTVTVVSTGVSASDAADPSAQAEATLDSELAAALTPGLAGVTVYECPNTDPGVLAGYSRIANDNTAAQVCTSWGSAEDTNTQATLNSEYNIFKQMAAQGQALFAASGDTGAYDDPNAPSTLQVDDPASQPYVTGVGGTTLTTAGAGGSYTSETTWNDFAGSGGGGGISTVWSAPDYQKSVPSIPSMRAVPDISLDSDPDTGYAVYVNGAWNVYGGTSAASPLWAGLTALVNSRRASSGAGRVGFLNPALYQIAGSGAYSADFHDIKDGSDNGYYSATPGYDEATGWGTPTGALLSALAAYGQATSTPVAAPPVHLAWVNTNGQLSLWNVDAANHFTFNNYGPYPGWSVTSVADGADGLTRILWNNTSGQASLWSLNNATGSFTQAAYGPYSGFAAAAVGVGADGLARLLWNRSDGLLSLWKVDAGGGVTFTNYGPYPGWTAKTIAVGRDNAPRILWTSTGGQMSLWRVAAGNTFTAANYGPYGGYAATALAVGADANVRVLWDRSDGLASLWSLNGATGALTFANYGPYPGYTPTGLAAGGTSIPHLLWTKTDGSVSLWNDVSGASDYSHAEFGPYGGWSVKAISTP